MTTLDASSSMAAVAMTGVNFTYAGRQEQGLKDINLTIESGEFIVLTGESGCGKTSLIRLMNGLIPSFYEGQLEGDIVIEGKGLEAWKMDDLSMTVGSVFQNPRSQFFNVDSTSELGFACENMGISRQAIWERIEQTTRDFKIENLLNRDLFQLSGGEKQLLAMASVYTLGPCIFVLDEPSANLDAEATERLRRALLKLKKQGKTIIVAEHRLYYLSQLADRILYMKAGRIAHEWTPQDMNQLTPDEQVKLGLRAWDLASVCLQTRTCKERHKISLETQGLKAGYQRKRAIIHDLNVQIPEKSITGVIGKNGQGKSTFARCLCGLTKESEGAVWFEGERQTFKKRLGHYYLVMQDPNYQLFSDSVGGEIEISLRGKPSNRDAEVKNYLKQLGLEAWINQHPMSLSGGQKQRLSLAAGMAQGAEVLILDEPTSGLDYKNMCRVKALLNQLKAEGKEVIVITHDYEFLVAVCDYVVEIDQGQVIDQYPLEAKNGHKLLDFFVNPA